MVRSFFDPSMFKQMMPNFDASAMKQMMPSFDSSAFAQMMPKQGLSGAPVFDLKLMMETQRKNVQAMTEAMQLGMEGMQQAWSRQAELMSDMVSNNSNLASSLLTEGTPEQKIQRQAELMRDSYETTLRNVREVSDILAKSGEEAAELINRRVSASLTEFKASFDRDVDRAASASKKAAAEGVAKAKKVVRMTSKAANEEAA